MSKKPEFNLTNEQKIEFGKIAIKKIAERYPGFLSTVHIDDIKPNVITLYKDRRNMLIVWFENNGLSCRTNVTSTFCLGCFDNDIQPLYSDYMYQTFGEPYRKAALAYWQEQSAKEHQQFQARKAEQIARLDQEEQALLTKHNTLLDFLSKGTNKKLEHFAAPDMKPKGADKTMNDAAKQALPQDNGREML